MRGRALTRDFTFRARSTILAGRYLLTRISAISRKAHDSQTRATTESLDENSSLPFRRAETIASELSKPRKCAAFVVRMSSERFSFTRVVKSALVSAKTEKTTRANREVLKRCYFRHSQDLSSLCDESLIDVAKMSFHANERIPQNSLFLSNHLACCIRVRCSE
jgi:hypothetical protein